VKRRSVRVRAVHDDIFNCAFELDQELARALEALLTRAGLKPAPVAPIGADEVVMRFSPIERDFLRAAVPRVVKSSESLMHKRLPIGLRHLRALHQRKQGQYLVDNLESILNQFGFILSLDSGYFASALVLVDVQTCLRETIHLREAVQKNTGNQQDFELEWDGWGLSVRQTDGNLVQSVPEHPYVRNFLLEKGFCWDLDAWSGVEPARPLPVEERNDGVWVLSDGPAHKVSVALEDISGWLHDLRWAGVSDFAGTIMRRNPLSRPSELYFIVGTRTVIEELLAALPVTEFAGSFEPGTFDSMTPSDGLQCTLASESAQAAGTTTGGLVIARIDPFNSDGQCLISWSNPTGEEVVLVATELMPPAVGSELEWPLPDPRFSLLLPKHVMAGWMDQRLIGFFRLPFSSLTVIALHLVGNGRACVTGSVHLQHAVKSVPIELFPDLQPGQSSTQLDLGDWPKGAAAKGHIIVAGGPGIVTASSSVTVDHSVFGPSRTILGVTLAPPEFGAQRIERLTLRTMSDLVDVEVLGRWRAGPRLNPSVGPLVE